jgi:very-short-patch-repair endonuclease
MSPPEVKLWSLLRHRPDGFKFRRQRPNDPFIFDFYCHEALLAIEIDGFAHDCGDNPRRDQARDRWAAARSIATLRIDAAEVRDNLEGVLVHILARCAERTPPPPAAVPLPSNSRGG